MHEEPPPEEISTTIGRIAGVISSEHFPTGERAALKRLNFKRNPPLAFYRFAFNNLPGNWEKRKTEWMTIVAGMAIMCPEPHRLDRPLGKALAESGYSEARLDRLLSAEGEILSTLILRAARFLAAKGETCDWSDIARLLLTGDPDKREKARLRIADYYYHNLKSKE